MPRGSMCCATMRKRSTAGCSARKRRTLLRVASDGYCVLFLGKNEDDETDGLQDILIYVDKEFCPVNGQHDDSIRGAPPPGKVA